MNKRFFGLCIAVLVAASAVRVEAGSHKKKIHEISKYSFIGSLVSTLGLGGALIYLETAMSKAEDREEKVRLFRARNLVRKLGIFMASLTAGSGLGFLATREKEPTAVPVETDLVPSGAGAISSDGVAGVSSTDSDTLSQSPIIPQMPTTPVPGGVVVPPLPTVPTPIAASQQPAKALQRVSSATAPSNPVPAVLPSASPITHSPHAPASAAVLPSTPSSRPIAGIVGTSVKPKTGTPPAPAATATGNLASAAQPSVNPLTNSAGVAAPAPAPAVSSGGSRVSSKPGTIIPTPAPAPSSAPHVSRVPLPLPSLASRPVAASHVASGGVGALVAPKSGMAATPTAVPTVVLATGLLGATASSAVSGQTDKIQGFLQRGSPRDEGYDWVYPEVDKKVVEVAGLKAYAGHIHSTHREFTGPSKPDQDAVGVDVQEGSMRILVCDGTGTHNAVEMANMTDDDENTDYVDNFTAGGAAVARRIVESAMASEGALTAQCFAGIQRQISSEVAPFRAVAGYGKMRERIGTLYGGSSTVAAATISPDGQCLFTTVGDAGAIIIRGAPGDADFGLVCGPSHHANLHGYKRHQGKWHMGDSKGEDYVGAVSAECALAPQDGLLFVASDGLWDLFKGPKRAEDGEGISLQDQVAGVGSEACTFTTAAQIDGQWQSAGDVPPITLSELYQVAHDALRAGHNPAAAVVGRVKEVAPRTFNHDGGKLPYYDDTTVVVVDLRQGTFHRSHGSAVAASPASHPASSDAAPRPVSSAPQTLENTEFWKALKEALPGAPRPTTLPDCVNQIGYLDNMDLRDDLASKFVHRFSVILASVGGGINAQNKEGDTALIIASRQGLLPIVRALIGKGADRRIEGRGGATALSVAQDNLRSWKKCRLDEDDCKEIVRILGGDPDAVTSVAPAPAVAVQRGAPPVSAPRTHAVGAAARGSSAVLPPAQQVRNVLGSEGAAAAPIPTIWGQVYLPGATSVTVINDGTMVQFAKNPDEVAGCLYLVIAEERYIVRSRLKDGMWQLRKEQGSLLPVIAQTTLGELQTAVQGVGGAGGEAAVAVPAATRAVPTAPISVDPAAPSALREATSEDYAVAQARANTALPARDKASLLRGIDNSDGYPVYTNAHELFDVALALARKSGVALETRGIGASFLTDLDPYLAAGGDINVRDSRNKNQTLLIRAARAASPVVVQGLLERGADCRLEDAEGKTAEMLVPQAQFEGDTSRGKVLSLLQGALVASVPAPVAQPTLGEPQGGTPAVVPARSMPAPAAPAFVAPAAASPAQALAYETILRCGLRIKPSGIFEDGTNSVLYKRSPEELGKYFVGFVRGPTCSNDMYVRVAEGGDQFRVYFPSNARDARIILHLAKYQIPATEWTTVTLSQLAQVFAQMSEEEFLAAKKASQTTA